MGRAPVNSAPPSATGAVTYLAYPLGEKSADKLKTPTGKNINDVTLEAVISGEITGNDVRITPETLEMQAQVAESRGRTLFASNLMPAAVLIAYADHPILQLYYALIPFRITTQNLTDIPKVL